MNNPVKILIVEDEMVIAANISLQLTNLGYEVSGIVSRGEDALLHMEVDKPDILLLDINLKGKLNGIETATIMQEKRNIPHIYLTANANDEHFKRAKQTHPYGFISKPFKKLDLQRAIELTVERLQQEKASENKLGNGSIASEQPNTPFILSDRIFVRHNEKMIKIDIKDIYYVEAERNYCRIFSKDREYLLVTTLKEMDEKMPSEYFMRIHRSYIINLSQLDEVGSTHVVISKKAIPMSKDMRTKLLERLQTI